MDYLNVSLLNLFIFDREYFDLSVIAREQFLYSLQCLSSCFYPQLLFVFGCSEHCLNFCFLRVQNVIEVHLFCLFCFCFMLMRRTSDHLNLDFKFLVMLFDSGCANLTYMNLNWACCQDYLCIQHFNSMKVVKQENLHFYFSSRWLIYQCFSNLLG